VSNSKNIIPRKIIVTRGVISLGVIFLLLPTNPCVIHINKCQIFKWYYDVIRFGCLKKRFSCVRFSFIVRAYIVQSAFDKKLSQACIVYKRLTFIVFRVSFSVYRAFERVRLLSQETFSARLRSSKRLSTIFSVWYYCEVKIT
jgi:hypothetical protein